MNDDDPFAEQYDTFPRGQHRSMSAQSGFEISDKGRKAVMFIIDNDDLDPYIVQRERASSISRPHRSKGMIGIVLPHNWAFLSVKGMT